MPHFNIGKSKLSSLPMTIRLVRLVELIAFVLMGTESKSRQYEARTISIVFLHCPVSGRVATKITEFNNGPVTSLLIKPDSVATITLSIDNFNNRSTCTGTELSTIPVCVL